MRCASWCEQNKCIATALAFDVAVALADSDEKSDAIQICVDHLREYSAEVLLPYDVVGDEVVYRETRAQKGKCEIFVKSTLPDS
jgi:hypothetical protein